MWVGKEAGEASVYNASCTAIGAGAIGRLSGSYNTAVGNGALGGGGGSTVQAYVVENDISDAQALQEELEVQATL